MKCEQIGYIFKWEPPTDHTCQVWFILSLWFLTRLKWKKLTTDDCWERSHWFSVRWAN